MEIFHLDSSATTLINLQQVPKYQVVPREIIYIT